MSSSVRLADYRKHFESFKLGKEGNQRPDAEKIQKALVQFANLEDRLTSYLKEEQTSKEEVIVFFDTAIWIIL